MHVVSMRRSGQDDGHFVRKNLTVVIIVNQNQAVRGSKEEEKIHHAHHVSETTTLKCVKHEAKKNLPPEAVRRTKN
jgi:hypothetical protein